MAVFDLHHPGVFAFGILGNVVSIFVYLSPLPTFVRIYKNKSTMGYQGVPYVVGLFSAMLWMYYALLKHAILLISINSLGCLINSIYISLFLLYASKEARKKTTRLLGMVNVGGFCGIFVVTAPLALEGHLRIIVVGWICVAFSVSVFAAPLSIVFQVVRTKSAEFMPFTLSLALTLSAVMWFLYGLLERDICVAMPNTVGFILGVLQMVLYGIYRKPPQPVVSDEKIMEEHIINVVKLHPDQVHPLESQASSSSCVCSNDVDDQEQTANDSAQNHSKWAPTGDQNPVPPALHHHQLDSPAIVACPA